MDIRNFFSPVNKSSKNSLTSLSKEKKRKLTRIDSDDEEPIPLKSRKAQKVASDSDDDLFVITPKKENKRIKKANNESPCSSNTKTGPKSDLIPKLKPASVKDFFGSSPVSQSKKPSTTKIIPKTIIEDHDDDFSKTLLQLNECHSSYSSNLNKNNKSDKHKSSNENLDFHEDRNKIKVEKHDQEKYIEAVVGNLNADKNVPNKTKERGLAAKLASKIYSKKEECDNSGKLNKPLSDKNKFVNSSKSPLKKSDVKNFEKKQLPKEISVKKSTPLKSKSKNISSDVEFVKHEKENKVKEEELSEIPATPEAEKKKQNSFAYRKYLQRSGPRNPGGKPLPEGKPNCLFGLTFVLTGILETIDREETAELIKKYGGKVTTSISKNTSYVVVGEEAGESKLKKAEQLNTKQLNEDELFTLISCKSPSKDVITNSKVQTPKRSGSASSNSKLHQFQHDSSLKKKIKLSDEDSGVSSCSSSKDSSKSLSPPSKSSFSPLSEKNLFSSPGSSQISSSATSSPQNNPINSSLSLMWVDKYKPLSLKKIIGQYGPQSNANKLHRWLSSWTSNHTGDKKLAKPSPWSKDNTGAYFKAALLSGPPGIGKTTTAHLACKELEFDAVEMNASDTRSKRALSEDVSELLSNTSLVGFASGSSTSRNHVLIMDEVDGMAGNEDRGGIQEMIGLIKSSRIPIIFMCNDRNHPKIRSLANHCYDLRFSKPKIEQIRGAMMSVCAKEGIKIKPEALDQVIIGSNLDLRQVLHHLSMWSVHEKNIEVEQTTKDAKMAKKDFKLGPWDVVNKVFSESSKKGMSIHDKVSLFFNDYSIGPLFVQENYLKAVPHNVKGNTKILQLVAKTASVLSDGDLIEKAIRKDSSWSLLPSQALFSSILPGEYMSGHFSSQVEFPKWLGNNSRKNKFDRLAQELHTHLGLRISGTKQDVISDYAARICEAVVQPLAKKGSDGVKDSVVAMTSHDLIRDDLESLIELTTWPGIKDKMAGVDSKVKAAFTRALNKDSHLSPYSCGSAITKKKLKVSTNDEFDAMEDEEEQGDDEDDDDDITKDAMIKPGKKSTANKDTKASTSKDKGGKSKRKK